MPFLGVQPSRGLVGTAGIDADAVTGAKIADDTLNSEHYIAASIDNEHLADDAVGVAELSATGTASSSTFLRGDNSWAAPGGGGLIYLGGATASSSSTVDLESMINNSTYDVHKIFISGLQPSTGATIRMRLSDDNGTSYESSGYKYAYMYMDDSSSTVTGHGAGVDSFIGMGEMRTVGSDSDNNFGAEITLYHFKHTTLDPLVIVHGGWSHDAEDDCVHFTGTGAMNSTGADIDAVQFYPSSGNISVGEFRVYGIAKS